MCVGGGVVCVVGACVGDEVDVCAGEPGDATACAGEDVVADEPDFGGFACCEEEVEDDELLLCAPDGLAGAPVGWWTLSVPAASTETPVTSTPMPTASAAIRAARRRLRRDRARRLRLRLPRLT